MASSNRITIVAASDNHYAILLGVLLKSIEVNHKTPELLDFYIIDDGISADSKQKIVAASNNQVSKLNWLKTKDVIPPNVKIPIDKSAYPITTYLRLFAPYIIPADVERFIYIDVDMLVLEDISRLWHTDIGDHLFAAVIDIAKVVSCEWSGVPNYKELGMNPDTPYFNAGIMIIDPLRWREEDLSTLVVDCIHENIEHVNYADQYGLNVALANRWFALDPRWNSFSVQDTPDPFVIHFIDIKPIFKSYNGNKKYYDLFYQYLKLTKWANFTPVSNGSRLVRKLVIKMKKLPGRLFREK